MLLNLENIDCVTPHDSTLESDIVTLWSEFRKGNKQSFEKIYRMHIDSLYYYGILLFKDTAVVEDAIQDMFVDLWRRKEFLKDTTSIKFYLRKALKRNITRKLEGKERLSARYTLPWQYVAEVIKSPEEDTISRQVLDDTAKTLFDAIASLPEKQREIIVYKFYDNLSSQEISSVMCISLDSVYTQLSRAVKELRKRIKISPLI